MNTDAGVYATVCVDEHTYAHTRTHTDAYMYLQALCQVRRKAKQGLGNMSVVMEAPMGT